MGQHAVAEDAHWPPFLVKGVELVRAQKSQGQDTSKFEAFLIGILSHQVSDVSWHSLGIFEGLLRAMAESEFDGDYDKAHSVLDVGGDMIQLSRRTVKKTKSAAWNYDVDDIQALLRANNYTDIPNSSIRYCMARGHAAYSAELKVASVGFKMFARLSPMLFDELESYFAGGLTDMHEQIEECIPSLMRWITTGSDENPWSICQVFQGSQLDSSHPFIASHTHNCAASFAYLEEEDEARDIMKREMEQNDNATESSWSSLLKYPVALNSRNMGKVLDLLADIVTQGRDKAFPACKGQILSSQMVHPPHSSHLTHERVANVIQPSFGQALLFWENDLVVSAPSEGRVYVYSNSTSGFGDLKLTMKSRFKPKQPGDFTGRFGAATAVWKGHLVISSPGINKLDIFDKNGVWKGGIEWKNTSPTYGSRGLKLIGESLASDVITNRLYIGAPYVDIVDTSVHVEPEEGFPDKYEEENRKKYESKKKQIDRKNRKARKGDSKDDNDNDNDNNNNNNNDYDGDQKMQKNKNDKYEEGEDGEDGIDRRLDQVGMVFTLTENALSEATKGKYIQLDPLEHRLYEGRSHYEQAGSNLYVTSRFILIGAPGKREVLGFDPITGRQLLNLSGSTFHPNKPSGFGKYMIAGKDDVLAIGSPAGSLETIEGKTSVNQKGVVSIFKHRRAQNLEGPNDFDWFGSSGVVSGSSLYVVSPHAANGRGQLWKVDMEHISFQALGSVEDSFASRFGAAIATNDEVIAVGMPYYGIKTGKTRRGAVAIISI